MLIGVGTTLPVEAADREPSDTKSIAAGLNEYTYRFDPDGDDPDYTILVIDAQSSSRTRLLAGNGSIEDRPFAFPSTLADLKSAGAPVLISGAYSARVGSAFIPLGYLKVGGKEISGRIHHSWIVDTMACLNEQNGRFHFDKALISDTTSYQSCFQIGPRLFQAGIPIIQKLQDNTAISGNITALPGRQTYMETPYMRLFICKGELASDDVFGITDRQVTIFRLLQGLPELTVNRKHICRDVIELGDNTAAGILINGELVAGSDSFLLTSAILLTSSKGK